MKHAFLKPVVLAGIALTLVVAFGLRIGPLSAQAQQRPAQPPATQPDDHESAKFDLGTQKIGDFEVQVGQVAEAKAGAEAIFIIKVKGTGKPRSVRAWIGIESGQGSIRTAAEEEKPSEWHAHHQVSRPMPANSKLWVELETTAGRSRASLVFKQ